jgi:predicted MFS family arabinose efflux permease
MLVVFNCWGLGNAYGLFQAYYSTVYLPNTNPSSIAWIGSTQLALVFALGVPVGRMVDKGCFRLMFHGGTLLMISGLMLSSVCTHLWSLWLVNGLITGLGVGMCFCSGIVALMTWFDERKIGSAMALGAAGSCIGGIVYVLLARYLLKARGFRSTMLILGSLAAATMIPPNLVFRVRGQSYRHRSPRPDSQTQNNRITWTTFTAPSYLLAASGMFFSFLGIYFGFVYIPSFAYTVLHMSPTASSNLLIFMLAANLPGRFVPALISDRCIGPLNTMIPSIFLSSAVIWLWAASEEQKGSFLVVRACFYGFVSAGVQVLYAPVVYSFCLGPAVILGEGDGVELGMERVGVKAGGIFTCIGLACFVGLPVGGALIDYRTRRGLDQPYWGAQSWAGAWLLVGGCLLLGSRVARSGWAARRT